MFPPHVVLAATDFSESSRVALDCAARLAQQCGAELHVLHAQDPMLTAAATHAGVELTADSRDELKRFAASVVSAGARSPVTHVVVGPSVQVIRDIAERECADVIVVGMHGMSGAERAMFGSTTEGVLRKATTSVLVVPDGWRPPRPDLPDLTGTGPIVAAVDQSMAAFAAARVAARLAALLGTSVDAVHIVPPVPVPARWSAHADAALRAQTEAARTELASALRHIPAEAPMTLHVESGHVAERLAALVAPSAARHPVLVLGRRTPSERDGAPGTTAYRVLTMSEVPVLMHLPDD